MATEEKEREVLFQGTGYRICKMNDLNVVLEREGEGGAYSFVGYYACIVKALKALVQRDILIDRSVVLGLETYLKQIETQNQTILNDIDRHMAGGVVATESDDEDDLFN